MLLGIDSLLNGEILLHLDRMGHSDLVVIADAHFPAHRLGRNVIDVVGTSPRVVKAVRSVIELDDVDPVTLMFSSTTLLDVQAELLDAAGVGEQSLVAVNRTEFYETAALANLILRTTETRIYANAILRKGVTG